MYRLRSALCAIALAPTVALAQSARIPSPSEHLGFQVGADRTLADWSQITGYFARLATISPAVEIDTLGRTTDGQPFIVAVISTPANIARLPELRANQAKLADPNLYSRDPKAFANTSTALGNAQTELAEAEEKWLELEMLREEIESG